MVRSSRTGVNGLSRRPATAGVPGSAEFRMAELRWFGHNCFRIRAREATVLTDPVGRETGYPLSKQTADVVTVSHDAPETANLAAVKPEFTTINGPGEYEVHDVFVTGIRTRRGDDEASRQFNTVYLIEVEGLTVCHLGDLGHGLSDDQAEGMANVDLLLIPVGNPALLTPAKAAEIVGQLAPKLVIPMQFATDHGDRGLDGMAAFCTEVAMEAPPAEEKLVIRQSDLGEATRLAVLSVSK